MATDTSEISSTLSSISSPGAVPEVTTSKDANSPNSAYIDDPLSFEVQPKASIPGDISSSQYAQQCIAAAEASRLNPYALHIEEYNLLKDHLTPPLVTTYLNIRNGILRLWTRNPMICVSREEAVGCAKDARWFAVAELSYEWLARSGYINYGCLDIPSSSLSDESLGGGLLQNKTIVVIGAGISGLACARQLEGLFAQFQNKLGARGLARPKVVVLEGRSRVGGRVYSRKLESKASAPQLETGGRCTAEMGGMIITGFDRGNPLNVLVRGQLGLKYHALRPTTTLYDYNGEAVNQRRDQAAENLYNDILDRVSEFKFQPSPRINIEGDHELVSACRDSYSEGGKTLAELEAQSLGAGPTSTNSSNSNGDGYPIMKDQPVLIPVSSDRLTGRSNLEAGIPAAHKAAYKARLMGWRLQDGINDEHDLELQDAVTKQGATLGTVMDTAIAQYRKLLHILPLDLRLINWHAANLEYSNATNYNELSLAGWDVDAGNEWDGEHTMVVGGYQQVARGLLNCPRPLVVHKNKAVHRISYSNTLGKKPAMIECEDGTKFSADTVISTIPLGVLKANTVNFEPALPDWKCGAISRLGFGTLNKIILVYKEPFWDTSRDIFGVLRAATQKASLNQGDYRQNRGRFFQWFNCSNTSGLPTLIALMAGDAALQTEAQKDEDLVSEATSILQSLFGPSVPQPVEAIITRWGRDKFAKGSYSYTGPNFRPDDYDMMAKSVHNLFFAGEHTSGTHPATVHGAYLSGLRVASEVLDDLIGPITVLDSLIAPRSLHSSIKRKASQLSQVTPEQTESPVEAYENNLWKAIYEELGPYPIPPPKATVNPYILFCKANFEQEKRNCDRNRRPGKGRVVQNEVRTMLAKKWKETSEVDRQPFQEQALAAKLAYKADLDAYFQLAKKWDTESLEFRKKYEEKHPNAAEASEPNADVPFPAPTARRAKRVNGYAESEDSASEMEMDI
jgi:lysine-specific histone demethylase 1